MALCIYLKKATLSELSTTHGSLCLPKQGLNLSEIPEKVETMQLDV